AAAYLLEHDLGDLARPGGPRRLLEERTEFGQRHRGQVGDRTASDLDHARLDAQPGALARRARHLAEVRRAIEPAVLVVTGLRCELAELRPQPDERDIIGVAGALEHRELELLGEPGPRGLGSHASS